MTITLRPALPADAARLAEIYLASRKTFLAYAPLAHADEDVRAWMASALVPSGAVTAALRDDELVGLLAVSHDGAYGWVDQLYLAPSAVGAGIGSQLLELAKRALGSPIRLHTFQANTGGRRFYRRHGFREIATSDGRDNEEKTPDVLFEWRAD